MSALQREQETFVAFRKIEHESMSLLVSLLSCGFGSRKRRTCGDVGYKRDALLKGFRGRRPLPSCSLQAAGVSVSESVPKTPHTATRESCTVSRMWGSQMRGFILSFDVQAG